MLQPHQIDALVDVVLACPNVLDDAQGFWSVLPSRSDVPPPKSQTPRSAIREIVKALDELEVLDELEIAAKHLEAGAELFDLHGILMRTKGWNLANEVTKDLKDAISDVEAFEIANLVLPSIAAQVLKDVAKTREGVIEYLALQATQDQPEFIIQFVARCGGKVTDAGRKVKVAKLRKDLAAQFGYPDPGVVDGTSDPFCPVLVVVDRNASQEKPCFVTLYLGADRRRANDLSGEVSHKSLPAFVDKALNIATEQVGKRIAVELMLPIEIIAAGSGEWQVTIGDFSRPLDGCCPVSVRSLDRRDQNVYHGFPRTAWEVKSREVQTLRSFEDHSYYVDHPDDFHDELLPPFQPKTAFFSVTMLTPDRCARLPFGVLKAFFSAGMPLGVWLDERAPDPRAAARELRNLARYPADEIRRLVHDIRQGDGSNDFPNLAAVAMTLFFDPDDLPTVQFQST